MTRPRSTAIVAALLALVTAVRADAQACATTETRTAIPQMEGAVVRSVAVRTDAPSMLPIAGAWLAPLRRTTETGVVSRQLLFAPGDHIDTVLVAETLRRLRDQRLYSDVVLTVIRCAGSDTLDLLVTTRDAWTLKPTARIVPPSTVSIGLEDRNVLGSGRAVAVTNDQSSRGHGGSAAITDPWMFGTDMIGAARFADVAGNHLLRLTLRHHELSEFDPWRMELGFGRQRYGDFRATEHPLSNLFLEAHVGHIVGSTSTGIVVPYFGPEIDRADVVEIRRGDDGLPVAHRRDFMGVDVGLSRRAAVFDTASWFSGGRGFLDIPLGVESDALVGGGDDRAQHAAARYDGWVGRMWMPRRGSLLAADAWTSGYLGDVRPNHIDRFSLVGYAEAPNGFWGGRVMLEQLLQLDIDQRILTQATIANDPSLPAVPRDLRFADRTLVASIERSLHLRSVGRGSVIDGALFAAGSLRWDAPTVPGERFDVAVVGARLRLLSANGAIGSTRVDIGFPVASNGSIVHRPLISASVSSLLDSFRGRDGRRRHQ